VEIGRGIESAWQLHAINQQRSEKMGTQYEHYYIYSGGPANREFSGNCPVYLVDYVIFLEITDLILFASGLTW